MEIRPDFDLKEHYIRTAHISLLAMISKEGIKYDFSITNLKPGAVPNW